MCFFHIYYFFSRVQTRWTDLREEMTKLTVKGKSRRLTLYGPERMRFHRRRSELRKELDKVFDEMKKAEVIFRDEIINSNYWLQISVTGYGCRIFTDLKS